MVKSPLWQKLILVLGLVLLCGGLFFYIHLGVNNRHWADDWCYNADLRNKGFVETLNGYFYDTTYTPSRYSVTIFTGLLQTFDVAGTQALTPLTLLFWVAGLLWTLWNITRLTGATAHQTHDRPVTALLAFFSILIVYFSVHLSPHLYQSLYWRTGLLTYTTPLVLMTWVFALITRQGLQPSQSQTALAGLLALLAGGCSEAGATVLVSALGLYVGVALLYRRQPWAQKTLLIASVSLLCAIVAMSLLVFSPTTQIRSQRYGDPTPLTDLPRLIFNYTYAFFVISVREYQHALIALLSALVGFVFPLYEGRAFRFRSFVLLGLSAAIIAFLLVAASLTPSIYVEKGLPAPRTMIIPQFLAVCGFALGGWAAGSGMRVFFKVPWLQTAAAVAFLFALAFPVYTLIHAYSWEPIYAGRAEAWDVRAAAIQSALSAGASRVTVEAIDGLPVGGIRDFDPPEKKGYWITQCGEAFYGIKFDVALP